MSDDQSPSNLIIIPPEINRVIGEINRNMLFIGNSLAKAGTEFYLATSSLREDIDKISENFEDFRYTTRDLHEKFGHILPIIKFELEEVSEVVKPPDAPEISLSGIITPEKTTAEGALITAHGVAWSAVIRELSKDWTLAYQISPTKWEEIIAGAFDRAGFDEVILTPRSGDYGRDVIAIRRGVGSIKIISSVKAYAPGNLVSYDDIRALMGVLSSDRDASKGMVVTTSDFPPKIARDRYIAPLIPTRLELLNGVALKEWLKKLSEGLSQ